MRLLLLWTTFASLPVFTNGGDTSKDGDTNQDDLRFHYNKNTGPWEDIQRVYLHDTDTAPPKCDYSKSYTELMGGGDSCIIPPPLPPAVKGAIKYDMYSNAIDLLALSQYIYEIVELRQMMRDDKIEGKEKHKCLLQVSIGTPQDFWKCVHPAIEENQPALSKKKKLKEALEFLEAYFNIAGIQGISNETVVGRTLYVIDDSNDAKRRSYVHAISRNDAKKRVDIVFRGTSQGGDWWANLNALWKRKIENPIKAMRNTLPYIKLHRGFAHAILGDPGNKTAEETYKKTIKHIKEIMPADYRLFVSGHSLGGATATLFAFFAAIDEDFKGPIHLYSFASPRVGGHWFRQAFKWLEERGRIRHARIHNMHDKVPHHPWFAGKYKHVGMQIRLDNYSAPNLDYPTSENWFQKMPSNILEHLYTTKDLLIYHDCIEMFRRIQNSEHAFRNTSLQKEYVKIWNMPSVNGTFLFLNTTSDRVETGNKTSYERHHYISSNKVLT